MRFRDVLLVLPFLILTLPTSASIEPESIPGWFLLAGNSNGINYMKVGTFDDKGKYLSAIIQQRTSTPSGINATYYKLKISKKDCDQGYGAVVFYNLSGGVVRTGDYVKQIDGGTVDSSTAGELCALRDLRKHCTRNKNGKVSCDLTK